MRLSHGASVAALLLALATTVATVAFLEMVLRRRWQFEPRPRFWPDELTARESRLFVQDSLTGWRMRPNGSLDITIAGTRHAYHADAQGFRSGGACTAAAGPLLALVGDSFTFGYGVAGDETWHRLLLRARADSSICNLGMPGFGIDQMLMAIRYQALPLAPARVLLAFVDDDLERSLTAYRLAEGFPKPMFELDGGGLRPATRGDRSSAPVRFLQRHSALWRAGQLAAQNAGRRLGWGTWWRVNAAILKEAARDTRAAGVSLVVVRLPSAERLPRFVSLQTLLDSLGVPLLDLEAGAECQDRADFLADGHSSAAGHACIAGRIAPWLASLPPR